MCLETVPGDGAAAPSSLARGSWGEDRGSLRMWGGTLECSWLSWGAGPRGLMLGSSQIEVPTETSPDLQNAVSCHLSAPTGLRDKRRTLHMCIAAICSPHQTTTPRQVSEQPPAGQALRPEPLMAARPLSVSHAHGQSTQALLSKHTPWHCVPVTALARAAAISRL